MQVLLRLLANPKLLARFLRTPAGGIEIRHDGR